MHLRQITPAEAKIFTDEELFDRISSDTANLEDWSPNPLWTYIGAFDDELIGYFMLHKETDNMLSIHINIKKEFRSKAKEAASIMIKMFNESFDKKIQKLTCRIPVIYPEVYHFTKSFGFEDEGLCKKSIMKNGELVDQHILGLQRVEK